MSADTETTHLPANLPPILAGFNRYGLPGMVIGVLFLFLGIESFYGIKALVNNTAIMTQMNATMQELKEQIKDCREGK